MRKVEITLSFEVEVHDDSVDLEDLMIEFEEDLDSMMVVLSSDTQTRVKANVMGYETISVDEL